MPYLVLWLLPNLTSVVTMISATQPVAVGDFVYTEASLSPHSQPLYCGRIVRAEVAPTASQWTIDIAPLYAPAEVPVELQVMRTELKAPRRQDDR